MNKEGLDPTRDRRQLIVEERKALIKSSITPVQWGNLHDWDLYIEELSERLKTEPRSWVERWKLKEKEEIMERDRKIELCRK